MRAAVAAPLVSPWVPRRGLGHVLVFYSLASISTPAALEPPTTCAGEPDARHPTHRLKRTHGVVDILHRTRQVAPLSCAYREEPQLEKRELQELELQELQRMPLPPPHPAQQSPDASSARALRHTPVSRGRTGLRPLYSQSYSRRWRSSVTGSARGAAWVCGWLLWQWCVVCGVRCVCVVSWVCVMQVMMAVMWVVVSRLVERSQPNALVSIIVGGSDAPLSSSIARMHLNAPRQTRPCLGRWSYALPFSDRHVSTL